MSKKRKILIGVGVLVLVAVLASLSLRAQGGDAVEVRTTDVSTRDLIAQITATGHIEPKTSVDISADVSGRIVELAVEEGQQVERGELLLRIDPTQFQAAVQRARAALAEAEARETQARAAYDQARRESDRIQALARGGENYVTEQEVEQSRTEAEVQHALWTAASHGVDQARAALREAQDRLGKAVIRAPMSGTITRLNVDRGETAVVGTMNNPGSLLLTVADLSVMEAVLEVDETDIPDVEVGDSAVVRIDAFPDRTFQGTVTKIGNSSIIPVEAQQSSGSEQAIDFEVRVTIEDPGRELRPDLSTTADVVTARREDVLAIPIIALTLMEANGFERIPNENRPADTTGTDGANEGGEEDVEGVFVVQDGRARFRPVEIGIAGDNHFEVLSGLEEGMTVISGPYQTIRDLEDGQLVEATADSAGEAPVTAAAGA